MRAARRNVTVIARYATPDCLSKQGIATSRPGVVAAGRRGSLTADVLRQPVARPVGNLWPRSSRRGLSLFEVVIALAVFVGSIAAIGQLISTGVRAAVKSRLQSQAVLRCESKMAEVVAGITPLRGSANGQFPDDASWSWQVQVAAGPHEGLYIVEVTATHPGGTSAGNQSFALRRMVRDPQLQLDEWAKEQAEAASSSNSSANSSTSGSSSSGSTGGGS